MKPDICIYHANCNDGFAAAWVVWLKYENEVQYVPGFYEKSPPDVTGKHVIMVDFSYKHDVILELAKTAKSITIIDHHKSALEDLKQFQITEECSYKTIDDVLKQVDLYRDNVCAIFDMNHSGVILTWKFFFPDIPPPSVLNHVEDQDLARFKLDHTKEILAYICSFHYNFQDWLKLILSADRNPDFKDKMIFEGRTLLRNKEKDIRSLLTFGTRKMVIGGYLVNIANAPKYMGSDVATILSENELFAAAYVDSQTHRVFSLRSRGDKALDVSKIAESYGGGGHYNAAGFSVVFDDLVKLNLI